MEKNLNYNNKILLVMKTNTLFFFLAALLFGFSCKKSEVATSDFACDKITKITKQSFGDLTMTIEYVNGKISKVYRADGKGLVENYTYKSATELLITRNFTDGSIGNTFNTILNDKGYFLRFVTEGYSINYIYDSNGYLISNATTYPNASQNTNTTYSYLNNNRTQGLTFTNKVLSYTEDFTYYEDKLNKVDNFGNQNRPDFYGKFSNNLVKTYKITYPDKKFDLYEYSYEQNINGFVKTLTEKYTDQTGKITSQVNKYEYDCL